MAGPIKKKTAAASKRKADAPTREPESEAPDNDESQEDEGVPPKRKHTAAASDSEAPESDEHDEDEGEAALYDDSIKPKRARSAFSFWLAANRGKFSKKGAGRAWRGLKDKSEWNEMAKLDKERYGREMAIYDKKHAGDED